MKIGLLVAIAIVMACGSVLASDSSDTAASTVLACEQKWNEAYKRSDIVAMNALLADDFIITLENGSTLSKSGYIAHNGNSTVQVQTSEMSDVQVRMHGNTAVVTGAYEEKGVDQGKPYEYQDRFTDIWMDIKGRWQVIASHYSVAAKQDVYALYRIYAQRKAA